MSENVYAVMMRDSSVKGVCVHCSHAQGPPAGRWPAGLRITSRLAWGCVACRADRRYRSATLTGLWVVVYHIRPASIPAATPTSHSPFMNHPRAGTSRAYPLHCVDQSRRIGVLWIKLQCKVKDKTGAWMCARKLVILKDACLLNAVSVLKVKGPALGIYLR